MFDKINVRKMVHILFYFEQVSEMRWKEIIQAKNFGLKQDSRAGVLFKNAL